MHDSKMNIKLFQHSHTADSQDTWMYIFGEKKGIYHKSKRSIHHYTYVTGEPQLYHRFCNRHGLGSNQGPSGRELFGLFSVTSVSTLCLPSNGISPFCVNSVKSVSTLWPIECVKLFPSNGISPFCVNLFCVNMRDTQLISTAVYRRFWYRIG